MIHIILKHLIFKFIIQVPYSYNDILSSKC